MPLPGGYVPRGLTLEASDGTLRLQPNEAHWCRVELQLGERLLILGAEMRETVVARLTDGLRDALVGKIAGAIEGVPVRWIISLSEEHCTVYGCDVDGSRRLYFQDRDAKLIATVTLSLEERTRWLSALQSVA